MNVGKNDGVFKKSKNNEAIFKMRSGVVMNQLLASSSFDFSIL